MNQDPVELAAQNIMSEFGQIRLALLVARANGDRRRAGQIFDICRTIERGAQEETNRAVDIQTMLELIALEES